MICQECEKVEATRFFVAVSGKVGFASCQECCPPDLPTMVVSKRILELQTLDEYLIWELLNE